MKEESTKLRQPEMQAVQSVGGVRDELSAGQGLGVQDRKQQPVCLSCLCFLQPHSPQSVGLWAFLYLSHLPIRLIGVKFSKPQKRKKKWPCLIRTQQRFCNLLPEVGELKDQPLGPAPHGLGGVCVLYLCGV